MQSKALMTVAMLVKNNPDFQPQQIDKNDSELLPSKENIMVYDSDFVKLFSFHEEEIISNEILTNIKLKGEYKFSINNYDAVGIRYTTNYGKELIIIAKGIFMSEELIRLGNIMLITFFLFLIVIAAFGYYFSGHTLLPITKTMNELDKILPSDLSKRLQSGKNKDELSRLSGTFNKLLDRIEEAFNIQKGFLSNVSHELRNPLASIISRIQVDLSKDRTIDEYKKCLHSVLSDAVDLEHTSTQLMDLARISSQSDHILFGPVRIDEVLWQAKGSVKKSNPEFSFIFDTSSLPENAEDLIINANEALLKTAFINLLENACKFSPDHKSLVKIIQNSDKEIAVEIRDSAPIIPESEKEQIFKPFYRSDVTNTIKGSGIGLSLVASILNVHESRLTLKNGSNKGNIFTVHFKSRAQEGKVSPKVEI
jgi:signal transduction histidine kinase